VSTATAELTGRNAQKLAFVFPGQGSQYVMAAVQERRARRAVFSKPTRSWACSSPVSRSPAARTRSTRNRILTVSLAAWPRRGRWKTSARSGSRRFVATAWACTALVAAGAPN
jgi:hypothetical protein